jgi:hypothetical protein
MTNELIGNRQLLNEVCGLFKIKGTSLHHWCNKNGIAHQNARAYIRGLRNGPIAKEWRRRIVEEARRPMKDSVNKWLGREE